MAAPTNVDGGVLDGVSISGAVMSRIITALVSRRTTGPQPGVVWGPDNPLQLYTDGSDLGMWVKARPGAVVFESGRVIATNTTTKVFVDAANGSFPRADLIIAEETVGGMRLRAVTGTPAQSPTPPATPAGAEKLGSVTVPAAAVNLSGGATDARRWTQAAGGLVVCTEATRPAAGNGPMLAGETDTGALLYSNGSVWEYLLGAPETAITAVNTGLQVTRTLRISRQAGMVRLRGAIGPATGNFATGVTIELGPGGGALIPAGPTGAGFRPISTISKAVGVQFGGGVPVGRVDVNPDGTVELRLSGLGTATTVTNAVYLDLEWPGAL